MDYVRLVGDRCYGFSLHCFSFFIVFVYSIGGVDENKYLPNYIEKFSLLKNAKDHQIPT